MNAERSAQESIEKQRLEIQGILKESVEPALSEIAGNLTDPAILDSSAVKISAEKITTFIDTQLRPLAESFHQRKVIEVPAAGSPQASPSLVLIPKFIMLREVTSPLAIYLVLIGPNTTGLYPYRGFAALPIVIVMFFPMFLIQMAALSLPIARRPLPGRLAILVLTFLFATSWLPAVYVAKIFHIDVIEDFNLIPTLTIGTTLVGALVTYGFVIDQERIRHESELFKANQALNLELNRTAQQVWLLRQQAAQILHGSVQSSLTAANMRIQGAGVVDDALLARVREDVERASIAISIFGNNKIKLEESLKEISDLWQGVCEVTVRITDELLNQISMNQVTSHCINEIVKESVTNAIRHGKARQVDILFQDLNDGTIQIEITNDSDTKFLGSPGVGSQMMDEITLTWSRELTNDGVRVAATVAAF